MITGLERRDDMPLRMSDPLVSWILAQVSPWERWQDTNLKDKYGEYYRIWRGIWAAKDKDRQVERCKLIAPATMQAVEAQVAEMEESIFARKRWFDTDGFNPTGDPELDREASEILTEFLTEDMELAGIKSVVTEALLNGALYGNVIIKINTEKVSTRIPQINGGIQFQEEILTRYEAVDPLGFVIDPAATNINDALGCAHIYVTPTHLITAKQKEGIYEKGDLGAMEHSLYMDSREENRPADEEGTELIEWHGKVPKALLERSTDALGAMHLGDDVDSDLVEAIVVIANRSKRLSAAENPYVMKDRGFVACQWDTVPNRFRGRGVVEKAWNSQKGLDTEIRARVDALSLSTYPMTVVNTLMAPRSMDSRVTPGKRVAVNGNPSEAMSILKLPGPDQNSYRHASDMERSVQTATGSISPSSPIGVNPTNETSGGMSMMLGAMFKRAKRTLRNIEEGVIEKLVQKSAYRGMQFQPRRYPFSDYKFIVNSGLSASAREFEVAQLNQVIQTMEPGGPEYWIILRTMLENYNIDSKDEILGLVQGRVEQAMNPPEPQPTFAEQMEMKKLELQEMQLQFKMQESKVKLGLESEKVDAEAERDRSEAQWSQSTAMANIAKMEAEIDKMDAEALEREAMSVKHLADARGAGVTLQ